jgi:hypothetical protein
MLLAPHTGGVCLGHGPSPRPAQSRQQQMMATAHSHCGWRCRLPPTSMLRPSRVDRASTARTHKGNGGSRKCHQKRATPAVSCPQQGRAATKGSELGTASVNLGRPSTNARPRVGLKCLPKHIPRAFNHASVTGTISSIAPVRRTYASSRPMSQERVELSHRDSMTYFRSSTYSAPFLKLST